MNSREKLAAKVALLEEQGVEIPSPDSLEIGDEVQLSRIQGPGTTLHAGTRLRGADLMIQPGARIGAEAPATVDNCAVGPDVELAGGYFADAVFLDRVKMGSGAHVREGTLMEEESCGAHTVGLKQTVLLPFVTLGSLINFCDVLMAGGTSRRDHSEVGSSFIHFNFTPFGSSGDKATASLVGDVPRGVMLRSPRIFLGGQAGLVGPVQIHYNTVLAAGFVYRRDHGPDQLVVGEKLPTGDLPFSPARFNRIKQKVKRNLQYIGNLVGLWHWYSMVRLPAASQDPDRRSLYRQAQAVLDRGILERIKRLDQISGYMRPSIQELESVGGPPRREKAEQRRFARQWPALEQDLRGYQALGQTGGALFGTFADGVQQSAGRGGTYLDLIRALDQDTVAAGTAWLDHVVDAVVGLYREDQKK